MSFFSQMMEPGGGVLLLPFVRVVIGMLMVMTTMGAIAGVARIHMVYWSACRFLKVNTKNKCEEHKVVEVVVTVVERRRHRRRQEAETATRRIRTEPKEEKRHAFMAVFSFLKIFVHRMKWFGLNLLKKREEHGRTCCRY
jgi:hypothetical protein